MPHPHDSWANVYEFVYEQCFGNYYRQLTEEMLRLIKSEPNKGSIIDFGAGTGRLSIPLAQSGYEVDAVEISAGMCKELTDKSDDLNLPLNVHHCSILDYKGGEAEMAIAIFTVLSYITTEKEMRKAINNISKHIISGGHFLFDLPGVILFNNSYFNNSVLRRQINITPSGSTDIYNYFEVCSGEYKGMPFEYEDTFEIRYWRQDLIDNMLTEAGLVDTGIHFYQFSGTGSNYKMYKKI